MSLIHINNSNPFLLGNITCLTMLTFIANVSSDNYVDFTSFYDNNDIPIGDISQYNFTDWNILVRIPTNNTIIFRLSTSISEFANILYNVSYSCEPKDKSNYILPIFWVWAFVFFLVAVFIVVYTKYNYQKTKGKARYLSRY